MKISTSIYKIRKASWGIIIKITASSEKRKHREKISNNVFYDYNVKNIHLTYLEKHLLKKGLIWISPLIENKIDDSICISITEIELNLCDYQVEGMFYGIAHWASEHFDFQLPRYEFSFDKEKNKYIFSDLEK